jgi:hypothetical protein
LFAVLAALMVLALHIAALTYPYPLFPHKYSIGEFTIRSSEPFPEGFERVVGDLRERLAAMADAKPGESCRVYVCGSERLYSFFSFLSRRPSMSQAVGLSLLDVVYLNVTRIESLTARTGGGLPYSRFDGNLAGAIAHEMAHFRMIDRLGYGGAMGLPVWKSEGWADYQTHLAPARSDIHFALLQRAEILQDDRYWAPLPDFFRDFYEWQAIVEYLAEVEGLGLEEVAAESVTEYSARRRFLEWYDGQATRPRSGTR